MSRRSASQGSRSAEIKDLAEGALQRLAEQLSAGRSDGLITYLKAMRRFHRYSITNLMLIVAQRPDATHVAGFSTWKGLGRHVNKGERGIGIIAPVRRRKNEGEDDEPPDDRPRIRGFRVVHVFDVSQTDGTPLPEPPSVTGDPGELLPRLEDHIRACGITYELVEGLGGPLGISKGGEIAVLGHLPPAQRFSVSVHELAHERLHKSGDRPPETVRETEAEAVAFAVCDAVGLWGGSAASDYIQLYQGDTETLAASLHRIHATACQILHAILPEDHESIVPKTQSAHRSR